MTWEKGESGNPNGRPPGITDKRMALRKILDEQAEALVKKAADMALAGDGSMMRVCLERLVPPYKSKDVALTTTEAIEGTLADQGRVVMRLLTNGELTPDEATQLMQAIASHARIVETDELAKRIEKLEIKHGT